MNKELLKSVRQELANSDGSVMEPVFTWANNSFSGKDIKAVEMLNTEYKNAISWFNAQGFPAIPNFAGESGAASYCFTMACMAQDSGILKEAWAGFHQALRRYTALDDKKQVSITCFNLGKVYGAQENWKMAQIMFKQSAHLSNNAKNKKGFAWSLGYLGDTFNKLGNKPVCKLFLDKAYEVMQEMSPTDAQNIAKMLSKLELGTDLNGENIMKECSSCHKKMHCLYHVCPYCGGTSFLTQSNEGSIALLDAMQRQMKASALVDSGAKYIQTGNYSEAETDLKKAIEMNPYNATAHGNMGGIYLRKGDIKEAIPWLEKALELNPHLEGVPHALAQAKAMINK